MAQIKNVADRSNAIQEMQGRGSHISNEPLLTEHASAERRPEGWDEFSVDDAMASDLGIREKMKEGWQPAWIRDGRYWGKHEMSDRFFEFRRANPGSEVVKVDGQPYTHGDLMLVLKPPQIVEQIAREREQREKEFYSEMESERKEGDWNPDDKEGQRRRALQNSQSHAQAGMIGTHSKTERLTLEEAYSVLYHGKSKQEMAAAIEAEERKWSMRGRTYVDRDEAPQESRRGGTTYSIPANVKPRNLAKS